MTQRCSVLVFSNDQVLLCSSSGNTWSFEGGESLWRPPTTAIVYPVHIKR